MKLGNSSSTLGPRLYHHTKKQPRTLGLSSYRVTFATQLSYLTNRSAQPLSDQQWLNMLSNFMGSWFLNERKFTHPDSKTLLQILLDSGSIQLPSEGEYPSNSN